MNENGARQTDVVRSHVNVMSAEPLGASPAHLRAVTNDIAMLQTADRPGAVRFEAPDELPRLTPDAARCLLALIEGAYTRRQETEREAAS